MSQSNRLLSLPDRTRGLPPPPPSPPSFPAEIKNDVERLTRMVKAELASEVEGFDFNPPEKLNLPENCTLFDVIEYVGLAFLAINAELEVNARAYKMYWKRLLDLQNHKSQPGSIARNLVEQEIVDQKLRPKVMLFRYRRTLCQNRFDELAEEFETLERLGETLWESPAPERRASVLRSEKVYKEVMEESLRAYKDSISGQGIQDVGESHQGRVISQREWEVRHLLNSKPEDIVSSGKPERLGPAPGVTSTPSGYQRLSADGSSSNNVSGSERLYSLTEGERYEFSPASYTRPTFDKPQGQEDRRDDHHRHGSMPGPRDFPRPRMHEPTSQPRPTPQMYQPTPHPRRPSPPYSGPLQFSFPTLPGQNLTSRDEMRLRSSNSLQNAMIPNVPHLPRRKLSMSLLLLL